MRKERVLSCLVLVRVMHQISLAVVRTEIKCVCKNYGLVLWGIRWIILPGISAHDFKLDK